MRGGTRDSRPDVKCKGEVSCRRKFLEYFPKGFRDETYIAWEREYKWNAHLQWEEQLGREEFRSLLRRKQYEEIALHAVRIESRTNLLFSFEKMALRDAVKSRAGARTFATGLWELLYGTGHLRKRFDNWVEAILSLPRKQTRVLTWPLATVFPFIAQPETHFFLKPRVTQLAAEEYGYDFDYKSRPCGAVYMKVLEMAGSIKRDLRDMKPRDMIDVQSFLWVQGSDEY
jgi:hypothetical protein